MKKLVSVLLCAILVFGMMPVTAFAEGTDTIIDQVYVGGIDAPVVGETPDVEATCGEGYTITEITWVDSTGEYKDWVYSVEKFEAGHKYTVQVTLVTKEGYKYLVVDGYNEVTGQINMESATVYGSHSDTEVAIGYDFGEALESGGLMGDVDKSGTVDVADIMKLKALIMADKWSDEELAVGDMDGSKKLDVGDIMAIKNIIMSK